VIYFLPQRREESEESVGDLFFKQLKKDYEVVKPLIAAGATRGYNDKLTFPSRLHKSIGMHICCGRMEMSLIFTT